MTSTYLPPLLAIPVRERTISRPRRLGSKAPVKPQPIPRLEESHFIPSSAAVEVERGGGGGLCPRVKQLLGKFHRIANVPVQANLMYHHPPDIPPVLVPFPYPDQQPEAPRPPPTKLMREGVPEDEYSLLDQVEDCTIWAFQKNNIHPPRILAVKYYRDKSTRFDGITAEIRTLYKIKEKPHPRLLSFVEDIDFDSVRSLGRQVAIITEYHPCCLEWSSGILPPEALWDSLYATLAAEITQGLIHLHDLNIVHRDLKPGNILIDKNGHCIIADYNTTFHSSPSTTECIDSRTILVGTLGFIPPELYPTPGVPELKFDYRSDYWSLGMTLLDLVVDFSDELLESWVSFLTNEDPSAAAQTPSLREAQSDCYAILRDPFAISRILKELVAIPQATTDLILKLCKVNPEERLHGQRLLNWLNDMGAGGESGTEPPFVIERHPRHSIASWNRQFQRNSTLELPSHSSSPSPTVESRLPEPPQLQELKTPGRTSSLITPPHTPQNVPSSNLPSPLSAFSLSRTRSTYRKPAPQFTERVNTNEAGQLTPGTNSHLLETVDEESEPKTESTRYSAEEKGKQRENTSVVGLSLVDDVSVKSTLKLLDFPNQKRHGSSRTSSKQSRSRPRSLQVRNPDPEPQDLGLLTGKPLPPPPSPTLSFPSSTRPASARDSMIAYAVPHLVGDLIFHLNEDNTYSSPLLMTANANGGSDTYNSALNAHKLVFGGVQETAFAATRANGAKAPGSRAGFSYLMKPLAQVLPCPKPQRIFTALAG
ncbi:Protein kinase C delta type [Mycena indigotica]|uniref:Protein kinase C delta type n=1 Tax=Mycena indigotica TaxID=2126181 RepID=A0A8H6RWQ6_9AGAR|nr:Protein kinase C delta type [Mycena indigotica]KAF7289190.1 Protein kinase C delta type [Mycena indigotica]